MKLVIGGFAQGKLDYVLEQIKHEDYMVLDGKLGCGEVLSGKQVIVDHLHRLIRECLESGIDPEEKIFDFVEKHPGCILISDEIGNGIVPVDGFEREYRERTGRLLIKLAASAQEVVRVICGIGQKIK